MRSLKGSGSMIAYVFCAGLAVAGPETSERALSEEEIREAYEEIIAITWERIERSKAKGRTVTLKARYADFRTITRSHSLPHLVADKAEFARIANDLMGQILPAPMGIRLLGLTLAGLAQDKENSSKEDKADDAQAQLQLFDVED